MNEYVSDEMISSDLLLIESDADIDDPLSIETV